LEKPGWVPIVFAGAVPKGVTDALAFLIIGTVSLESLLNQVRLASLQPGIWFLVITVALVSALASRSDTARKLREELALMAYGGSYWQVWLRYFLRGLTCGLLASAPFLYGEYVAAGSSLFSTILSGALISTAGGIFYAAPSLTRIRSKRFAENYKG